MSTMLVCLFPVHHFLNLLGSTNAPSFNMSCPKKVTFSSQNSYLYFTIQLILPKQLQYHSQMFCMFVFAHEYTRILLMNTTMQLSKYGLKVLFMMSIDFDGAGMNLKGINKSLLYSYLVRKTIIGISSSLILSCWQPIKKSILENT